MLFYENRSASIQTCNLGAFANKIFKDSKGNAPNAFANILISLPPKKFSPRFQSGFQLN